jgi:hypothetical protein
MSVQKLFPLSFYSCMSIQKLFLLTGDSCSLYTAVSAETSYSGCVAKALPT